MEYSSQMTETVSSIFFYILMPFFLCLEGTLHARRTKCRKLSPSILEKCPILRAICRKLPVQVKIIKAQADVWPSKDCRMCYESMINRMKLLDGFYGWVILISFIAIMSMTSVWELCIYAPHLIRSMWDYHSQQAENQSRGCSCCPGRECERIINPFGR